jgi:hypothetical protein
VKWINGSCLACDFCQQSGTLSGSLLPSVCQPQMN